MDEFPAPLLLGIEGERATRGTARLLRDTRAAGVLLLGRNIRSPAQTRALVAELQEMLGRRLLVSVDHEGGWVLRFSSGLTAFPGNAALGAVASADLARRVGLRMGRELRALGIGINLAPVLDVVTERYNPGILIRSFGPDPRLVGRLGSALARGLQEGGVAACAKHFPGKGAATVDAHLALPTIRMSRAEHARVHLPPFAAAVRAGVACVMTSHAVFPALDPSRAPATFSRRLAHGLLRERLGFAGVIVSDDLCMGAVTGTRSIAEASVSALAAGHDLLIVAHGEGPQREAAEAVARAAEDGSWPVRERRASALRVARLLERWGGPARGELPSPDASLPLRIARGAVRAFPGKVPIPLPLGPSRSRSLAVFWPKFREVRDRFTFEGGPEAPLRRLRARLRRWPARISFHETPIIRTGTGGLARAARAADSSLFFCFEAMRFPGQRAALEAVQKATGPGRLAVAQLRNPWEERLLARGTTWLHAFGYRDCQVEAMLRALEGRP